jgi:hypothetical protein
MEGKDNRWDEIWDSPPVPTNPAFCPVGPLRNLESGLEKMVRAGETIFRLLPSL